MKAILKYLIILTVALGFSLGAVSASELIQHDFDGEFTALAPADVNFEEENGFGFHIFIDKSTNLSYMYLNSNHVKNDNMNQIYSLLESIGLKKVNENGNITIFQANDDNDDVYGAGIYEEGKFVCITGNDLDELEKIAESVKFN